MQLNQNNLSIIFFFIPSKQLKGKISYLHIMVNENILIVEDEGLTSLALESLLKKAKYNPVATVSSGEEALSFMRENVNEVDLILMDIILDGSINGIDAAKEISTKYHTPIVFVTALEDMKTLESAKLGEPFGYIIKPVKGINDLRPNIETLLYNSKIKEEIRKKLMQIHDITQTELINFSQPTNNNEIQNQGGEEKQPLSEDQHFKDFMIGCLSALANADRFLIMTVLKDRPLKLTEIQNLIEKSRSATSHNLQILEHLGLIKGWKKGRFTYYSLAKTEILKFLENWRFWLSLFPLS
ncbi:Regulator of RpoS [Candidatus Lokiarchaeum ossiferum]|uniref:Regulator of RpoS n=1 Tax=Candidatus Lokiarchaeum ossiferum TaxID=2951803 RepID=A0ABY6HY69_9ARCH|nr:Regulator of RpoS [Candidatus Lokiarchaeum sp. B-35]